MKIETKSRVGTNPKINAGINKLVKDFNVFDKYARYIPSKQRRETFDEICTRYEEMLLKKYPELKREIPEAVQYVREGKILPSMRAMQFAGPPILKNNSRIYNCSYLPVDDCRAFSEIMFLLLGGTGVGCSVQEKHISQLPPIRKPIRKYKFLISDNIEGWADAVKVLMGSYMGYRESEPAFDYSDIRPKGSLLHTTGGKAPGPEPLKRCLENIKKVLEKKENGEHLRAIEVHDIICHIADAVLAGGVRRAALISLFSFDDEEMLRCKSGDWWVENPQRGRANNSAVALRYRITKEDFDYMWSILRHSGSGEPGIIFSNDPDYGFNPCVEASLRPFTFCNLTEVNTVTVESQEDFEERCRKAAFLGTLQAGFTDFHYLRPVWKTHTEKDALIGVSLTGLSMRTLELKEIDIEAGAKAVREENKWISGVIGINEAARKTLIKPSGTASTILSESGFVSNGIHPYYSEYFIRRFRISSTNPVLGYLMRKVPFAVEKDHSSPDSFVFSLPIQIPEGEPIVTGQETAVQFLNRVRYYNQEWVRPGFRKGPNPHNISATVYVDDHEWNDVREHVWEHRDSYCGVSFFPHTNNTYEQAPLEAISKAQYIAMADKFKELDINMEDVLEFEDNTDVVHELACSGGNCEI